EGVASAHDHLAGAGDAAVALRERGAEDEGAVIDGGIGAAEAGGVGRADLQGGAWVDGGGGGPDAAVDEEEGGGAADRKVQVGAHAHGTTVAGPADAAAAGDGQERRAAARVRDGAAVGY